MANIIENRRGLDSNGEINKALDSRAKLQSFLPKLNSFDAHLVNVFIEYEKER